MNANRNLIRKEKLWMVQYHDPKRGKGENGKWIDLPPALPLPQALEAMKRAYEPERKLRLRRKG